MGLLRDPVPMDRSFHMRFLRNKRFFHHRKRDIFKTVFKERDVDDCGLKVDPALREIAG